MKRLSGPSKTANLPRSIHEQLNMYALAASAAGVGMLALTPPAQARIIYTPTHRTIKAHHILHLDLNHDRIGDYLVSNRSFCTSDVCGRTLRVLPVASKNHVVGAKGIGGPFYAYALNRGVKIGPRLPFSGKLMAASGSEYGSVGQWFNVSDRYLGLKFVVRGKLHYGWARFSVIVGGRTITAALTGYAYETIPNKPIIAGKTIGEDEIESSRNLCNPAPLTTPGPKAATLGLLAMGTRGLSIWRRESISSLP
jgi:hypothetical protein